MLRFVLATAAKDLRRRFRDPLALALWLGIPFAILLLLSLTFGSGDVKPQARLLVVDEDDSFLSGFLVGAFGQGPMADVVTVEEVDAETGRRRIGAGDGSGLLFIPAGFGEAALKSQPAELTLLTNPSQSILPGILEETLSLFVDGMFYVQRLAGDQLAELAEGPAEGASTFDGALIAARAMELNAVAAVVVDYVSPPRLDVAVTVEEEKRASLNLGQLFFQSMFFLAILFMAQGMSDDVWLEERQGTLRRALTTPHGAAALLAGKYLAGLGLFAGVAILGVGAGAALYGFAIWHAALAAAWVAASGVVFLAAFTLLQLASTSQKGGNLLSNLILFPLVMVGGSFFPFEAMPEWLAAIGRKTPNGWALEQFKALLSGGAEPGRLALAAAGLAAAGFVVFALGARRLGGSFIRS